MKPTTRDALFTELYQLRAALQECRAGREYWVAEAKRLQALVDELLAARRPVGWRPSEWRDHQAALRARARNVERDAANERRKARKVRP